MYFSLKLPSVEAETLAMSRAPAWIWEIISDSLPRVPLGMIWMLTVPLVFSLTCSAKLVSWM